MDAQKASYMKHLNNLQKQQCINSGLSSVVTDDRRKPPGFLPSLEGNVCKLHLDLFQCALCIIGLIKCVHVDCQFVLAEVKLFEVNMLAVFISTYVLHRSLIHNSIHKLNTEFAIACTISIFVILCFSTYYIYLDWLWL